MKAECVLTELTTKEQSLQQLKPGVAPIAEQAPRVTSGVKKESAAFAPLLELGERATGQFKISYGKSSARLFWPGLCISSKELVQLLETLPRADRIHGVSKSGDTIRSFAYGDKLYRSKLAPPDEDGLLLYWMVCCLQPAKDNQAGDQNQSQRNHDRKCPAACVA